VTSQTAHTKYKWPPYATDWNLPMKIFCVHHWLPGLWFNSRKTGIACQTSPEARNNSQSAELLST